MNAHNLIDTGGIASLLGLTRAYVTDRLSKLPDFPKPKLNVSRKTRKWDRSDVEKWASGPQKSR
jgi:predicted DNA-binding transcriptional regulator AlpA